MMARFATVLVVGFLLVGPGFAQEQEEYQVQQDFDLPEETVPQSQPRQAGEVGSGVILRGMDKMSGDVVEFDLTPGQIKQVGRIQVSLQECRYPKGDLAGDAFAYLTIRSVDVEAPVFEGWMIASSPALSALDHPRYDIWVIRCTTS